jgi:hypothetical protein
MRLGSGQAEPGQPAHPLKGMRLCLWALLAPSPKWLILMSDWFENRASHSWGSCLLLLTPVPVLIVIARELIGRMGFKA